MRCASPSRMIARRFEELECWKLARELERRVYAFTATSPACKDLDYCRQIRKSSSSAPRNMAEGFGRFLPGDFAKFMRNALGSLNETRDHLGAGHEQGYLLTAEYVELRELASRATGASVRLAEYLERVKSTWRGRGRGTKNPRPRFREP
jgi:four helix bundle protein